MWNDVKTGGNSDKKEVKYLDLPAGKPTAFRVIDDQPYSRGVHWIQAANAGKGLSCDCIGTGCPACAEMKVRKANNTADRNLTWRKQHALNVINRSTGEVNVLDKGNGCFEPISNLIEVLGNPIQYDIMMQVSTNGQKTTFTPVPLPMKPLTPDELKLEKYDFTALNPKLTPEQITVLMHGGGWKEIFGKTDDATEDVADEKPDVDFTNSK